MQTLTPCVAVALCRALERACGVTPEIKWPNDLLINGKKLCGILVESSTVRGRLYVVIGMGLNINTAPADFPGGAARYRRFPSSVSLAAASSWRTSPPP